MNGPYRKLGVTLRLGERYVRVWKTGFEVGNQFGGHTYWFPWSKR